MTFSVRHSSMRITPGYFCVRLSSAVVVLAATMVLSHPLSAQQLNVQNVVRDYGYITMTDGVKLAYVVYRPTTEGRYPILLEYSPYNVDGNELDKSDVQGKITEFLERGYAYAGVAIRGASCSQGKLSMFDSIIADDGKQVVEWLATQPWSTGAVGMIGISYPGHTQIFTAAKRPKGLKAITPYAVTASAYREVWRPGGLFAVNFIGGWAYSTTRAAGAEVRREWGDTQCDVEKARRGTEATFNEVLQHDLHDEWWRARDLESYVGQIEVPTLMNQGWQDYETQISGAIRLFRKLNAPNKRLILQQGGHVVGAREISRKETLRWMDHWLKGSDNGVEKEAPITVWWDVQGDESGVLKPTWITTHTAWPIPGVKEETYYLTVDGTLSKDKPAASPFNGPRKYLSGPGTEMVANNDYFAIPPVPFGVLNYRTEPVTEDTTILGYSQFTFYLSSDQQRDTDVMVTLHDVDEQGNILYLQQDVLRASLRAIDTKNSYPDEQLRSFNKKEPLVPGTIYEMRLSIPPIGHVLRRGHSLELSIMTPPAIAPGGHWGFTLLPLPGRNTVYHSPQYPSRLVLPILPEARAQGPAPPCGALDHQPCRKAPVESSNSR